MPIEIVQIPCLSDNYGYLVHDEATGKVACIDTPDPEAINGALAKYGWQLSHIFNTHHHWDHTGGNLALKEKWGCEIVGPKGEADKIPGLDRVVGSGDTVNLGASSADVSETPGHTAGHIVYLFPDDHAAFVGDTIFALGCGRLFEGTAQEMWSSLSKISAWPSHTKLYCAHEYTAANAQFALSIEPDFQPLLDRAASIHAARDRGEPTVPMTVEEERATSPFLRAGTPELAATLGMTGAHPVDVFAEVRRRKDNF